MVVSTLRQQYTAKRSLWWVTHLGSQQLKGNQFGDLKVRKSTQLNKSSTWMLMISRMIIVIKLWTSQQRHNGRSIRFFRSYYGKYVGLKWWQILGRMYLVDNFKYELRCSWWHFPWEQHLSSVTVHESTTITPIGPATRNALTFFSN